jgi:hypothetical protein
MKADDGPKVRHRVIMTRESKERKIKPETKKPHSLGGGGGGVVTSRFIINANLTLGRTFSLFHSLLSDISRQLTIIH